MITRTATSQSIDYSFLRKFDKFLYNARRIPTTPEQFISIDGARISTLGNLLVISGPPKSGKTSLSAALIAGNLHTVPPTPPIDTLGLTVWPNSDGREVVYINTELGTYDFQNLVDKILERAGLTTKPSFFHALNLTGLSPEELIDVTDAFIGELSKVSRIRTIIIDGIADYVYSVNDPEPCTRIIQYALKVAKEYNAVVGVIIHKNPGKFDTKSRGHMGSELARKGEATIELKPEGDSVLIKGKDIRNASSYFSPRLIKYDPNKGYFVSSGTVETQKTDRLKKKAEETLTTLRAVFGEEDSLKYKELVKRIIPAFKVADRMAKNRIKDFRTKGLLRKDPNGEYALVQ